MDPVRSGNDVEARKSSDARISGSGRPRIRFAGIGELMAEVAVRLEIRGLVQGVGYRWSMVEAALILGARGWVRNRRDGSVEAMVVGSAEAVDRMVAWARKGPTGAAVDSVSVLTGEGTFDSFEQRPSA